MTYRLYNAETLNRYAKDCPSGQWLKAFGMVRTPSGII